MLAERHIYNKLKESRKVHESEESKVFHHDEETETPEDILNEDWRSGTFTKSDLKSYSDKMMVEAGRMIFSINQMSEKHPEFQKEFKALRDRIKGLF